MKVGYDLIRMFRIEKAFALIVETMVEIGNEDVDEPEDKNEGWGLMILLCDQQERGRRGVFMHSLMTSTIPFPLDPEFHCQSLLFFLRFPFFLRTPGSALGSHVNFSLE